MSRMVQINSGSRNNLSRSNLSSSSPNNNTTSPPTSILKKQHTAVIPPSSNPPQTSSSTSNNVTIDMSRNESKSTTFKCCWCMDVLREPIQLSSSCSHYGCAKCVNLLLNFEKLKRCCSQLETTGQTTTSITNKSNYEIPCPCCANSAKLSLSYEKVQQSNANVQQEQQEEEEYNNMSESNQSSPLPVLDGLGGGSGGDKINPYLLTLVDEEFKELVEEYGNTEMEGRMCANCESTPASCQCETCKFILCHNCFASIHDQKLLSSHKKTDLKPGNYIPITGKCMKHPGKDLDLFCLHDGEKVCSLCAISDSHNHHQCIQINDHISQLHDNLKDQAEHLFLDEDSSIHSEISNINAFLQHADEYYVQSRNFIEENFGKIESALKKRKEDLLRIALETYKNPNLEERMKLLKTFSFTSWRQSIAKFTKKLNEEEKINQTSKRLAFIENYLTINDTLRTPGGGEYVASSGNNGNNLEASGQLVTSSMPRSQTPMLEDNMIGDIINMIELITISKDEHATNQESIKHDKKFKSMFSDMVNQNEHSVRKSVSITCLSSRRRFNSTQ